MSFDKLAHGKTSLLTRNGGEDRKSNPRRSPAIKRTATCGDFGF
jgi:hypothetical protein